MFDRKILKNHLIKNILITITTPALITGIVFLSFQTVLAEELDNDVFDISISEGVEYNGFIVKAKDNAQIDLDKNCGIEQYEYELYKAPTIEAAEQNFNPDDIEYIEPNYRITYDDTTISDSKVINDPLYPQQWGIDATNAYAILNSDLSTRGVVVGVVDSGLSLGHEDLDYSLILEGTNVGDGSANVSYNCKHGTGVIGVIAGTTNNSLGVASLAYGATIAPIKDGDDAFVDLLNVAKGIRIAADKYNCDVINVCTSFEVNVEGIRTLEEACQYAYDNGAIIIASGGNENVGIKEYPAAFDTVIGVGAIGTDGDVMPFAHHQGVFVTAPGENISVLAPPSDTAISYRVASGTSFSTPYIASLAAIARGYDGDITFEQFRDLLKNSVNDKGSPGYDEYYGWGVIDCGKFYQNLTGQVPPLNKDPMHRETNSPFNDVKNDYWGYNDVLHCYDRGLIKGVTDNVFEPSAPIKRGDFVTIIGRIYEKKNGVIADDDATFNDVPNDSYYSRYIAWATKNGIVDGYGDGRFGPQDYITREQLALMFGRYAKSQSLDEMGIDNEYGAISKFTDMKSISMYAVNAMEWASERGILKGITDNELQPKSEAQRAQVCAMVCRFIDAFDIII